MNDLRPPPPDPTPDALRCYACGPRALPPAEWPAAVTEGFCPLCAKASLAIDSERQVEVGNLMEDFADRYCGEWSIVRCACCEAGWSVIGVDPPILTLISPPFWLVNSIDGFLVVYRDARLYRAVYDDRGRPWPDEWDEAVAAWLVG